MAHTIYITRAAGWVAETDPAAITRLEWQQYVAADPEMQLNDYANDPLYTGGAVDADLAYESYLEGLAAWLGHPGQVRAGEYAWFSHQDGQVLAEDPDAETLQKARAIARALHARVRDETGYLDEEAQPAGLQPEESRPAWVEPEFRSFRTYASAEAAQPLLARLGQQGIDYRTTLDTGQLAFDPSFANQQRVGGFVVKLRTADFEHARQLQEQLDEQVLPELPADYYLFSFRDDELLDILARPDEWSSLDVTLAQVLLRRRGHDLSAEAVAQLRQKRLQELARPEKNRWGWILLGYVFAVVGGLVGILIGWQLYFHRKTLPDGRRVYAYAPAARRHGLLILVLGVVALVVLTIRRAATWYPSYWQEIWQ